MCGIVGAASSWLTPAERDIFKDLLVVSNLRGWQGAGAITARNACDSVEVFKTIGSGLDLAHSKDFNQDLFHRKDNRAPSVLIGHTRWPTKGAVSLDTTHPHVHNGIYGVHNGTIDSIDGKIITKDESDSALLFKTMGERGAADTIREVRGAYALVWIDDELKTLNFLRNDKRPLHFAQCANGTFYWASEAAMLQFVLGRAGIKYELLTLPVDKWHQIEMPMAHAHNKNKITVVDLKGKAPEVAARAPFLGGGTGGGTTGTTISKAATSSQASSTPQLMYLRTYWDVATGTTLKEASFEKREHLVWDNSLGRWFKPNLVKSATVVTLSGGKDKPRKTWDYTKKDWVDIAPPSVATTTTTDTKTSGPESTSTSKTEVDESVTESFPSLSDSLDAEAARLVADEDAATSSGTVTIDDLFPDGGNEDDAFVETSKNCWVSRFQFHKYFMNGCCWCGDTPTSAALIQWPTPNEYICAPCRNDDYARRYCGDLYGTEITAVEQSLDTQFNRIVAA